MIDPAVPSDGTSHRPILHLQDLPPPPQDLFIFETAQYQLLNDHLSTTNLAKMSYQDTFNTDSQHHPYYNPKYGYMVNDTSVGQWNSVQAPTPTRYDPFSFTPDNHCEVQDTASYTHTLGTWVENRWNFASTQDPRSTNRLTRPRNFIVGVNDTVDAMTGPSRHIETTQQQVFPSPSDLYTSIESPLYSTIIPAQYQSRRSAAPSIHRTDMLGTYPRYDSFESQSPAISRSLSESTHTENMDAITPDPFDGIEAYNESAPVGSENPDPDEESNSEPYAQLIFRALKSAPNNQMILKQIYEWFVKHTDKAKGSNKGWQNSIRHNLSMNGAFRKVEQQPPVEEGKKGFVWFLEPSALKNGVESTTRYRKNALSKKTGRTEPAAAQRQRSGAKGGKATKKAAKMRRSQRNDAARNSRQYEHNLQDSGEPQQSGSMATYPTMYRESYPTINTNMNIYGMERMPFFMHTPSSTVQSSIPETSPFPFGHIVGCTTEYETVDVDSLFYDSFEQNVKEPLSGSHTLCDAEAHLNGECPFSGYSQEL